VSDVSAETFLRRVKVIASLTFQGTGLARSAMELGGSAEYRADLVLFLLQGTRKVLGIVVEVQLGRDEDKRYAWPAYVTNLLRARHRCPVCLLVVTVEESMARWAGKSIELGPGNWFRPWVIGPANTPLVTEVRAAEQNVELAVLSACEHGQSDNIELASRVASVAIQASEGIDAERSRRYLDLILMSISENAREAVQTMDLLGFEYQSDFARHFIAKGRAEGRAEMVIELLTLRFGRLSEDVEARLRDAERSQLDALAKELLTASTLSEALKPLE
jgi:hypothetical protein